MWELVTVGGTPYAGISSEELYPQLQSGMRMACPAHCAQEVYVSRNLSQICVVEKLWSHLHSLQPPMYLCIQI